MQVVGAIVAVVTVAGAAHNVRSLALSLQVGVCVLSLIPD